MRYALCIVLLLFGVAEVSAATRLMATNGTDSGDCTGSACRTWGYVRTQLSAGDTIQLANGTYNNNNSGYPFIDCSGGWPNGSVSQPMTVKAQNERQAFIQGDGSTTPFWMRNCSYWTVQGLHVENANNISQGGDTDAIMVFKNSFNLTIRRNLVAKTNQAGTSKDSYVNQHAIMLQGDSSLIEENELYWFNRHGIILTTSSNNIVRRNYSNSRGCSPNGCNKQFSDGSNICAVACDKGDSSYIMYTGTNNSNNIFENNISETTGAMAFYNAHYTPNDNNRFYGNISLNDDYGLQMEEGRLEGDNSTSQITNALMQDTVVINPLKLGMPGGARSMTIDRATIMGTSGCCGGGTGFIMSGSAYGCGGSCGMSFVGKNILSINNASTGINVSSTINTWSLDHTDSFGNFQNYSATTAGSCTNCTSALQNNPVLGQCLIAIPASSPMHNAGVGGTVDIGGNVVFQYSGGVLTSTPLWSVTNQFTGCGAIVAGVNDIAGQSCSDVGVRLHVGTANGCTLPGGSPSPPAFTFSVVPATLLSGRCATLTWSAVTNDVSSGCVASMVVGADSAWTVLTHTQLVAGGSKATTAVTGTRTYRMSCSGTGGTTTVDQTVSIGASGGSLCPLATPSNLRIIP
jgi:hypothetical protein